MPLAARVQGQGSSLAAAITVHDIFDFFFGKSLAVWPKAGGEGQFRPVLHGPRKVSCPLPEDANLLMSVGLTGWKSAPALGEGLQLVLAKPNEN